MRSIGWGLFLASSWTWCIGMFLPVLLLRDWGWPGFVVFAIANVIGATAVGFLWSRERSRLFVEHRWPLLKWFSLATISFQTFFVTWMASAPASCALGRATPVAAESGSVASTASTLTALLEPWTAWLLACAAMGAMVLPSRGRDGGWLGFGSLTLLGSLVLWAFYGTEGLARIGVGDAPLLQLFFLAPVILLGFLVCPHLDLSFHRTVQHGPRIMPWLVFAIAFPSMLFFTASSFSSDGVVVTGPLIAWWFIQASFTAAAHAREIRAHAAPGATASIAAALLLGAYAGSPQFGGESTYLRFLGLYAAIFPCVALLLWRGYRSLGVLAFLALAIPFFELGFLGWSGTGSDRSAWAPLIPLGVLLGLLRWPINNGVTKQAPAPTDHA